MSTPADRQHWTHAEHRELERTTGRKHELVSGEVYAMTGSSPRHSFVKTNLTASMVVLARGGPCEVYDSDLSIRIGDNVFYPDLSVHCGPLDTHPEDGYAAVSPVLIAEVLSPSTEGWDRGVKFACYREIAALRHVLFVDPDKNTVEHYQRDGERWVMRSLGREQTLVLGDLELELSLTEVLRDSP